MILFQFPPQISRYDSSGIFAVSGTEILTDIPDYLLHLVNSSKYPNQKLLPPSTPGGPPRFKWSSGSHAWWFTNKVSVLVFIVFVGMFLLYLRNFFFFQAMKLYVDNIDEWISTITLDCLCPDQMTGLLMCLLGYPIEYRRPWFESMHGYVVVLKSGVEDGFSLLVLYLIINPLVCEGMPWMLGI